MEYVISKISWYFYQPHERFDGYRKVDLDLSKCATKVVLRRAIDFDISKLAEKSNLVDELDVDKLKTVSADTSNVVDNDVVKKLCMINWIQELMLLVLR